MSQPTGFTVSKWTKFTFLGWFAGIAAILLLSSSFDLIGLEGFQFFIGVGMGGSVGFFQSRILRHFGIPGAKWFWCSLLGLGIPFLIHDLIFQFVDNLDTRYHVPLSVMSGGIIVSILQYLILKKFSTSARTWIWGGFISWTLAMATVLSIDYIKLVIHHNWTGFVVNLTMILGGGVVLGISSGLFLIKILPSRSDP